RAIDNPQRDDERINHEEHRAIGPGPQPSKGDENRDDPAEHNGRVSLDEPSEVISQVTGHPIPGEQVANLSVARDERRAKKVLVDGRGSERARQRSEPEQQQVRRRTATKAGVAHLEEVVQTKDYGQWSQVGANKSRQPGEQTGSSRAARACSEQQIE